MSIKKRRLVQGCAVVRRSEDQKVLDALEARQCASVGAEVLAEWQKLRQGAPVFDFQSWSVDRFAALSAAERQQLSELVEDFNGRLMLLESEEVKAIEAERRRFPWSK